MCHGTRQRGESFSLTMKGGGSVSISDALYMETLNKLVKAVKKNPSRVDELKERCVKEFANFVRKRQQEVIITMLTRLYSYNYNALKRDAAMISLMELKKEVSREERLTLLTVLWNAIGLYFKDDYSFLINGCQRVINFHESCGEGGEDLEDLPFI